LPTDVSTSYSYHEGDSYSGRLASSSRTFCKCNINILATI